MADSTVQKGYRVTGRVQGVGFRWWTQKKGLELGIEGTVRNLPDGAVEVHAVGVPADLDKLKGELAKGPWSAAVRGVEEISSTEPLPKAFEVRF